jgi:hypothetical protein
MLVKKTLQKGYFKKVLRKRALQKVQSALPEWRGQLRNTWIKNASRKKKKRHFKKFLEKEHLKGDLEKRCFKKLFKKYTSKKILGIFLKK